MSEKTCLTPLFFPMENQSCRLTNRHSINIPNYPILACAYTASDGENKAEFVGPNSELIQKYFLLLDFFRGNTPYFDAKTAKIEKIRSHHNRFYLSIVYIIMYSSLFSWKSCQEAHKTSILLPHEFELFRQLKAGIGITVTIPASQLVKSRTESSILM